MSQVLDKELATASGVALIRNGEIVEFFPRVSNENEVFFSNDEKNFPTEVEESELIAAIEDFTIELNAINKKMQKSQAQIEKFDRKADERDEHFKKIMQNMEEMTLKCSMK